MRSKSRGREDLRNKFIVTIDPDDARDFDDAIHVEKLKMAAGNSACTSQMFDIRRAGQRVRPRARRRATAFNLPDRVIPMLPERLSNGVCSLKPEVDRAHALVFIQFDKRGVAKERALLPGP